MKAKWISILVLVLSALLVNVQQGIGQKPIPGGDETTTTLAVGTPGAIPIQGRLTNASGQPLTGTYSITFSLYEAEGDITALCAQTHNVSVTNGLFSTYLDNCYTDLYGQKVWLGVKVGADAEMTPRQVIFPVPYALSLRPGARIEGDLDGILTVVGTNGPGDYDSFVATAAGSGEAVSAESIDGYGVYAHSQNSISVYGQQLGPADVPAVYGCKGILASAICGNYDDTKSGVKGVSEEGDGIQGISVSSIGRGLYGQNTTGIAIAGYNNAADATNHTVPTLYLVQTNASGDFVVGAGAYFGTRYFRVDRTGKGFFNGGTQASGADFAEQIASEKPAAGYEPGDVLVISTSQDRAAALADEPFSTLVLGVYSTQPGYLAGAPDTDDPLSGLPVAVVGIVPCKVSAENGPIRRGDLLVTSRTAGHAMRAGANPPVGAVLGKAMEALEDGTGIIQVLVTLN